MTDPAEALKLAHEIVEDYTNARNSFAGPTLGLVRANVVAQALIDRMEPVEIRRFSGLFVGCCTCGAYPNSSKNNFCHNCGKEIKWK